MRNGMRPRQGKACMGSTCTKIGNGVCTFFLAYSSSYWVFKASHLQPQNQKPSSLPCHLSITARAYITLLTTISHTLSSSSFKYTLILILNITIITLAQQQVFSLLLVLQSTAPFTASTVARFSLGVCNCDFIYELNVHCKLFQSTLKLSLLITQQVFNGQLNYVGLGKFNHICYSNNYFKLLLMYYFLHV